MCGSSPRNLAVRVKNLEIQLFSAIILTILVLAIYVAEISFTQIACHDCCLHIKTSPRAARL